MQHALAPEAKVRGQLGAQLGIGDLLLEVPAGLLLEQGAHLRVASERGNHQLMTDVDAGAHRFLGKAGRGGRAAAAKV